MVSILQKLRHHFLDYVGTIYELPAEEDRFPKKIKTAVRTLPPGSQAIPNGKRGGEPDEGDDEVVTIQIDCEDEDEYDVPEGVEYDEDEEEEDDGWIFLEDMRIQVTYDAFSDYWVVGYYPVSDIGIEVISRDLQVAVNEMIDTLTRQWSFLVQDVDECVSDLDKELRLFVPPPKDPQIIGWS